MDVSRRHFNFGIAGFLGALFMPKGSEASVPELEVASAASFNDHDHTPGYDGGGDVTLIGHVASEPVVKSYIKGDGSAGTRAFFRVAVESGTHRKTTSVVPIVAWGERAAWCARNLYKGASICLLGSLTADGDFHHVVLRRVETPRAKGRSEGARF